MTTKNKKTMKILVKILVTVGVLILFFMLLMIVFAARSSVGHNNTGIYGLILFAATISAIIAIWKSGKKDKKNGSSSILQK